MAIAKFEGCETTPPRYTADESAVDALAERVMPGWQWVADEDGRLALAMFDGDDRAEYLSAATRPLTKLSALFPALDRDET